MNPNFTDFGNPLDAAEDGFKPFEGQEGATTLYLTPVSSQGRLWALVAAPTQQVLDLVGEHGIALSGGGIGSDGMVAFSFARKVDAAKLKLLWANEDWWLRDRP